MTLRHKLPVFYRLPYYDMPASAGSGNPFNDGYPETAKLKNKPPHGADFMVCIAGDSMEPDYSSGDVLFVESRSSIDMGDIGIFIVDGKAYIKKLGKNKLISLNKKYEDIPFDKFNPPECKGKVVGICKEPFKEN